MWRKSNGSSINKQIKWRSRNQLNRRSKDKDIINKGETSTNESDVKMTPREESNKVMKYTDEINKVATSKEKSNEVIRFGEEYVKVMTLKKICENVMRPKEECDILMTVKGELMRSKEECNEVMRPMKVFDEVIKSEDCYEAFKVQEKIAEVLHPKTDKDETMRRKAESDEVMKSIDQSYGQRTINKKSHKLMRYKGGSIKDTRSKYRLCEIGKPSKGLSEAILSKNKSDKVTKSKKDVKVMKSTKEFDREVVSEDDLEDAIKMREESNKLIILKEGLDERVTSKDEFVNVNGSREVSNEVIELKEMSEKTCTSKEVCEEDMKSMEMSEEIMTSKIVSGILMNAKQISHEITKSKKMCKVVRAKDMSDDIAIINNVSDEGMRYTKTYDSMRYEETSEKETASEKHSNEIVTSKQVSDEVMRPKEISDLFTRSKEVCKQVMRSKEIFDEMTPSRENSNVEITLQAKLDEINISKETVKGGIICKKKSNQLMRSKQQLDLSMKSKKTSDEAIKSQKESLEVLRSKQESDELMSRLTSESSPNCIEQFPSCDFFQSLELSSSRCTVREQKRDEKLEDLSFFESIGLYWVNPADRTEERTEEVRLEEIDFLQELGLTPVVEGSKRWRLWQPGEGEDIVEDLLPQLYLPETAATDPIIMEDRAQVLALQKTEDTYCEPCNRNLASLDTYNRHLLTELHAKHVASEMKQKGKRKVKKIKFFDEVTFKYAGDATPAHSKDIHVSKISDPSSPLTQSSRLVCCPTCEATVVCSQYGKHLVSHFHYHKSIGHPHTQELLLTHIGDIVRQSPFQCVACSFYCNWHHDLVDHVSGHTQRQGTWHCQVCAQTLSSHSALQLHLGSQSHTELVSVVHRSVPVILRRLQLIHCDECEATFRFNFTLRRHMQIQHNHLAFQLRDQPKHCCHLCDYSSYRKSSVSAHQWMAHPDTVLQYHCHTCSRQFSNKEAVMKHRSSAQHRLRVAANMENREYTQTCLYCARILGSEEDMEKHLETDHYVLLPQCHLCGNIVYYTQQLVPHIRSGCKTTPGPALGVNGAFKCSLCNFCSHRESVLTLHSLYKHKKKSKPETTTHTRCPICKKLIIKKRLKVHIETHNANKFRCNLCYKKFELGESLVAHITTNHDTINHHSCVYCSYTNVKKSLVTLHMKRRHQYLEKEKTKVSGQYETHLELNSNHKNRTTFHKKLKELPFSCIDENCNFKAKFKSDLDRHMLKHTSTKSIECDKCDYMCKRKSELVRHHKLNHEDISSLQCNICEYKTKNQNHMTRHRNIHQELVTFEIELDENDILISHSSLS